MPENPKTRLVIEIKRKDSILIQFRDEEVEIVLQDDNPSNKARLCFLAPKSVEIMRVRQCDEA